MGERGGEPEWERLKGRERGIVKYLEGTERERVMGKEREGGGK